MLDFFYNWCIDRLCHWCVKNDIFNQNPFNLEWVDNLNYQFNQFWLERLIDQCYPDSRLPPQEYKTQLEQSLISHRMLRFFVTKRPYAAATFQVNSKTAKKAIKHSCDLFLDYFLNNRAKKRSFSEPNSIDLLTEVHTHFEAAQTLQTDCDLNEALQARHLKRIDVLRSKLNNDTNMAIFDVLHREIAQHQYYVHWLSTGESLEDALTVPGIADNKRLDSYDDHQMAAALSRNELDRTVHTKNLQLAQLQLAFRQSPLDAHALFSALWAMWLSYLTNTDTARKESTLDVDIYKNALKTLFLTKSLTALQKIQLSKDFQRTDFKNLEESIVYFMNNPHELDDISWFDKWFTDICAYSGQSDDDALREYRKISLLMLLHSVLSIPGDILADQMEPQQPSTEEKDMIIDFLKAISQSVLSKQEVPAASTDQLFIELQNTFNARKKTPFQLFSPFFQLYQTAVAGRNLNIRSSNGITSIEDRETRNIFSAAYRKLLMTLFEQKLDDDSRDYFNSHFQRSDFKRMLETVHYFINHPEELENTLTLDEENTSQQKLSLDGLLAILGAILEIPEQVLFSQLMHQPAPQERQMIIEWLRGISDFAIGKQRQASVPGLRLPPSSQPHPDGSLALDMPVQANTLMPLGLTRAPSALLSPGFFSPPDPSTPVSSNTMPAKTRKVSMAPH